MKVKKVMKNPDVHVTMGKSVGGNTEMLTMSIKKDKADFKKEDFQSLLDWKIAYPKDENVPAVLWRIGTLKEKNEEGVPIRCFLYLFAGKIGKTVTNDENFDKLQEAITKIATMALRMETFVRHKVLGESRLQSVVISQAPKWMQDEVAKQLKLKKKYY